MSSLREEASPRPSRRDLPPNLYSHEHGSINPPHPYLTAGAQTVFPFIRYPIGRAIVTPLPALICAAVVGFVLPFGAEFLYLVFTNRNTLAIDPGRDWLTGFAALYFVATLAHWIVRLVGHWRGAEVNAHEGGYSWLVWATNRLPVPLCEIVLVPLMVAAAAWLIWPYSLELSLWLWYSAFSMFVVGQWEQRRNLSQATVTIDDLVRARAWESRFDRQERKRAGRQKAHEGRAEPEFVHLDEEPQQRPKSGRAWSETFGENPTYSFWQKSAPDAEGAGPDDNAPMTRGAALKWLDLKEGATGQQIEDAYIRLIKQYHPDLGHGSTFIAQHINEARRVLLSKEQ